MCKVGLLIIGIVNDRGMAKVTVNWSTSRLFPCRQLLEKAV